MGYIIFSRQSSYPTITRAIAAKSQEVVHLCQTFRAQKQPALRIEQREEVSSVEWQKGGNAASAAIPRGMVIAIRS